MDAAPFDVQPIIERLKGSVSALRLVAGAADYGTVTKLADFMPPCAYVLLAREKATPNPPGNALPGLQIAVHQRVAVTFGVVLAVRNYRQQLGAQSQATLQTLLGAIRTCLIGWVPNVAGAQPVTLQQGNLVDYDAGTTVWTDIYATQHFVGVDP